MTGITGNVTDMAGVALQGATVTIHNNTGTTRTLVTNANGSFEALDLQPGLYQVTAELRRFLPSNINTEVLAGQLTAINIQLANSSIPDVLPVGTVVTSLLEPASFHLETGNYWVEADGRELPATSGYARLTGVLRAPDLRGTLRPTNLAVYYYLKIN